MTKEIKVVVKKLEDLGWERPDRKNLNYWKYKGTNRYVDIGLPYIDFYVYANEEKYVGYLTAAEFGLFNELIQFLAQTKDAGKTERINNSGSGITAEEMIEMMNNVKLIPKEEAIAFLDGLLEKEDSK